MYARLISERTPTVTIHETTCDKSVKIKYRFKSNREHFIVTLVYSRGQRKVVHHFFRYIS